MPQTQMVRSAQAEANYKLRAKVTRGNRVPKSVFKALTGREKLIKMGHGHHCCTNPESLVEKINSL